MYTQEGDLAVAQALEPHLRRLRSQTANGFAPTEGKLAAVASSVETEVERLGFLEVGDTAVREAIWAALLRG